VFARTNACVSQDIDIFYVGYNVGWNDIALTGNFIGNGRDQVVMLNKHHNWAVKLQFFNGQWHAIDQNQGGDHMAFWQTAHTDHWVVGNLDGDSRDEIMVLNDNHLWQMIRFW
jgi:hypothetical protein